MIQYERRGRLNSNDGQVYIQAINCGDQATLEQMNDEEGCIVGIEDDEPIDGIEQSTRPLSSDKPTKNDVDDAEMILDFVEEGVGLKLAEEHETENGEKHSTKWWGIH